MDNVARAWSNHIIWHAARKERPGQCRERKRGREMESERERKREIEREKSEKTDVENEKI